MRSLARKVANEWCYPEGHHSLGLVLTYHCVNTSKSARVPRIEIREIETNELMDAYIGYHAVRFLTLLNEECQELLK
jgi:hypothetical protein